MDQKVKFLTALDTKIPLLLRERTKSTPQVGTSRSLARQNVSRQMSPDPAVRWCGPNQLRAVDPILGKGCEIFL